MIMLGLSSYEATALGCCVDINAGGTALQNRSGNQTDFNRLFRKSDYCFNLFHRTALQAVVLLQSRQQTEWRQEKAMCELKCTTSTTAKDYNTMMALLMSFMVFKI